MTTTIWKFEIPVDDTVTINTAGTAVVRWLHVEASGSATLTLWAEVDLDEDRSAVVHVRGTGHPMQGNEGQHIGSVLAGPFVWHVFAGAS